MKKVLLLLAGVAMLATSCSSEEAVVEEQNAFRFEKTPEMVNFESALKDWMQSGKGSNGKAAAPTRAMEEQSQKLLASLQVDQVLVAEKQKAGGRELVALAMKEYSKKLTEMYKNRN